jgi:uncharacterized protein Yka (UPF0111/DUF47 family)
VIGRSITILAEVIEKMADGTLEPTPERLNEVARLMRKAASWTERAEATLEELTTHMN